MHRILGLKAGLTTSNNVAKNGTTVVESNEQHFEYIRIYVFAQNFLSYLANGHNSNKFIRLGFLIGLYGISNDVGSCSGAQC